MCSFRAKNQYQIIYSYEIFRYNNNKTKREQNYLCCLSTLAELNECFFSNVDVQSNEERKGGKRRKKKEERVGDEIDVMMDNNPSAFFLFSWEGKFVGRKKRRRGKKQNETNVRMQA